MTLQRNQLEPSQYGGRTTPVICFVAQGFSGNRQITYTFGHNEFAPMDSTNYHSLTAIPGHEDFRVEVYLPKSLEEARTTKTAKPNVLAEGILRFATTDGLNVYWCTRAKVRQTKAKDRFANIIIAGTGLVFVQSAADEARRDAGILLIKAAAHVMVNVLAVRLNRAVGVMSKVEPAFTDEQNVFVGPPLQPDGREQLDVDNAFYANLPIGTRRLAASLFRNEAQRMRERFVDMNNQLLSECRGLLAQFSDSAKSETRRRVIELVGTGIPTDG